MRLIVSLLLISISLLFTSCSNQNRQERDTGERAAEPTAGQVTPAAAGEIKIDPNRLRRESVRDTHDQQGNLVQRTENLYDRSGNIRHKHRYTYSYNKLGQRIEQWFYQYAPNGMLLASSVNHTRYNDKGLKSENTFISYDGDGNVQTWAKNQYEYNADGFVTKDLTTNMEGYPILEVRYGYENGLLASEHVKEYDGAGSITNNKTLKYNERGEITETIGH
jgi:hypothetical protein